MEKGIWTVAEKKEERFLRHRTKAFDFAAHPGKETAQLVALMRHRMKEANGIGLSANQIGLDMRVFVASVPAADGAAKFYAMFNPRVEKTSGEKIIYEEGCLSIPGVYGNVERPEKITIAGQDKNGKEMKIKAWGLLARVFQHEMDHLEGKLFIDRTKDLYHDTPEARLARRAQLK